MSIKLYQARTNSNRIVEIDAEKTTQKCFFARRGDGTVDKNLFYSAYASTFFTKEDAIQWRRGFLKSNLNRAYQDVAECTRKLDEFESSLLK